MAEVLLTVFIFVGVIAVTALVFGGWILVKMIRGIGSLLGLSAGPAPGHVNRHIIGTWQPGPSPMQLTYTTNPNAVPPASMQCGSPGCRQLNPVGARFCRRCGQAFPRHQTVAATARRTAV